MGNFGLQSLRYVTVFSSINDFKSKFSFNLPSYEHLKELPERAVSNANVLNVVLEHVTALTYCICFCLNYMGGKNSFIAFHHMFADSHIMSTTKIPETKLSSVLLHEF